MDEEASGCWDEVWDVKERYSPAQRELGSCGVSWRTFCGMTEAEAGQQALGRQRMERRQARVIVRTVPRDRGTAERKGASGAEERGELDGRATDEWIE